MRTISGCRGDADIHAGRGDGESAVLILLDLDNAHLPAGKAQFVARGGERDCVDHRLEQREIPRQFERVALAHVERALEQQLRGILRDRRVADAVQGRRILLAAAILVDVGQVLRRRDRGIILVGAVEIFDLDDIIGVGLVDDRQLHRLAVVRNKIVLGQVVARGEIGRPGDAVGGRRGVAIARDLEQAFGPDGFRIGGGHDLGEEIGGLALLFQDRREQQIVGAACGRPVGEVADQPPRPAGQPVIGVGQDVGDDILRIGIHHAAAELDRIIHLEAVIGQGGIVAQRIILRIDISDAAIAERRSREKAGEIAPRGLARRAVGEAEAGLGEGIGTRIGGFVAVDGRDARDRPLAQRQDDRGGVAVIGGLRSAEPLAAGLLGGVRDRLEAIIPDQVAFLPPSPPADRHGDAERGGLDADLVELGRRCRSRLSAHGTSCVSLSPFRGEGRGEGGDVEDKPQRFGGTHSRTLNPSPEEGRQVI